MTKRRILVISFQTFVRTLTNLEASLAVPLDRTLWEVDFTSKVG
jgi:hypothetical protein